MEWQKKYKEKLCSPDEAVRNIKSNSTVIFGHCIGEPRALVNAMIRNADNYENVEIKHMVSLGDGGYVADGMERHFHSNPLFVSANTRDAIFQGKGDFTPAFFHEIPQLIRSKKLKCDVLMTQVTPPDKDGFCSLGTSVDYTYQALKTAQIVIVQVNEKFPRTEGVKVHISEFDYIVEHTEDLYESKSIAIGDVEKSIASNCVDLIDDGSTLQLGIGGIPDAVIQLLGNKKNLGIHSEMISDGTLNLYEKGVINGSCKNFDKGEMTVTFLMGTKKLYNFVNDNKVVKVLPVDYVNHPAVIMKQHKMVCINSAIQIDLMGQVAAEAIGLKQFSGTGGQVDFIRGASMAEDGKSIIAMASYTEKKDGTIVSKITPFLDLGAAVTTSRNDIDYVVTELGIAELKGKSLRDRAKSLINISKEELRDELESEFKKRFHEKVFHI